MKEKKKQLFSGRSGGKKNIWTESPGRDEGNIEGGEATVWGLLANKKLILKRQNQKNR